MSDSSKYFHEDLSDNYLEKYRIFIRDEASRSINNLQSFLHKNPSNSSNIAASNLMSAKESFQEQIYSDSSYSRAADKLKSMLNAQDNTTGDSISGVNILFHKNLKHNHNMEMECAEEQKTFTGEHNGEHNGEHFGKHVRFYSNQSVNNSETQKFHNQEPSNVNLPSMEELVMLLHQESEQSSIYVQEINLLKEQISKLKSITADLMTENEKLNEDLHDKLVYEIIKEESKEKKSSSDEIVISEIFTHKDEMNDDNSGNLNSNNIYILNQSYISKLKALESQLEYLTLEKKELNEELNRMHEKNQILEKINKIEIEETDIASNLCINCSNVVSKNHVFTSSQKQSLQNQIEMLNTKISESNARENELIDKLKSNNRLVEQAQLEMSQSYIERERMRDDLCESRCMMKELVQNIEDFISRECSDVQKGYSAKLNELNNMNKHFMDRLNEKEVMNDRLEKEKLKIQTELEVLKGQIQANDDGYLKLTDNMKSIMQYKLDQSLLHQQLERTKMELSQSDNLRYSERVKCREEIDMLRNRLNEAETSLIEGKNECIQLHLNNLALADEISNLHLEKDKVENIMKENTVGFNEKLKSREHVFTNLLKEMQFKYENVLKALESNIRIYETYVQQLQNECKVLIEKLNNSSITHRKFALHLAKENDRLKHDLSELLGKMNKQLAIDNRIFDMTDEVAGTI